MLLLLLYYYYILTGARIHRELRLMYIYSADDWQHFYNINKLTYLLTFRTRAHWLSLVTVLLQELLHHKLLPVITFYVVLAPFLFYFILFRFISFYVYFYLCVVRIETNIKRAVWSSFVRLAYLQFNYLWYDFTAFLFVCVCLFLECYLPVCFTVLCFMYVYAVYFSCILFLCCLTWRNKKEWQLPPFSYDFHLYRVPICIILA